MKRRNRLSPVMVGLIAIVITAAATYLGFTKSIPFRQHYEIRAAFTNATQIKSNSPVRIAGIEVGKVSKVEAMEKGGEAALITMRIKKEGRPIKEDAQAKIRPRLFLEGNFFIDVSPGTPGAEELSDGETIPIENTSIPVQFDQVLSDLPAQTRANLRGTFAELFRAYSDGGAAAFNRSLEFQPDAYRFSSVVADALQGREPRDLSNLVRDFGTVAGALDANPNQLKALITDFNRTAGALAREEGALQATFRELPRTLAAAQPAFDALNRAFPDVRRFAREAVPGIRSSRPTLAASEPLLRQLRGLVSPAELRGLSADLRASVPPLAQFARDTTPMLNEMRLMASCANEVLIPWSRDKVVDEQFPASGMVYEEFGKVLPALAGESRSGDANGQWFKVLGSGGLETFTLGRGIFGTSSGSPLRTNPPKADRRPPLRPDVPCETQETPNLATAVGPGPRSVDAGRGNEAAEKREAVARDVAIETMNRRMRQTLGDQAPKVMDKDATKADIARLATEMRR